MKEIKYPNHAAATKRWRNRNPDKVRAYLERTVEKRKAYQKQYRATQKAKRAILNGIQPAKWVPRNNIVRSGAD